MSSNKHTKKTTKGAAFSSSPSRSIPTFFAIYVRSYLVHIRLLLQLLRGVHGRHLGPLQWRRYCTGEEGDETEASRNGRDLGRRENQERASRREVKVTYTTDDVPAREGEEEAAGGKQARKKTATAMASAATTTQRDLAAAA